MSEEQYDSIFLSLAQNVSQRQGPGIDPLLEVFFSFLRRKTDFFTGAEEDKIKAKLAEHVKKQTQKIAEDQERQKRMKEEKEKKAKAVQAQAAAAAPKPVAQPVKTASGGNSNVSIEMMEETEPQTKPVGSTLEVPKKEVKKLSSEKSGEDDEAEEESEEDKNKLRPNIGNGADLPNYVWTQNLKEANIQIPVPDGTSSKQIVWEISRTNMTVGVKGAKPILKGKLFADVRPDECHWTLEEAKGGKILSIHLDKVADMQWWDKIVEGEPAINTKKVQPENSKLSELEGETRQMVEKMMYDQRQKAMGLPSAEDQKKLDALERLKKANPNLDFSNVKLDGGGFGGGFGGGGFGGGGF